MEEDITAMVSDLVKKAQIAQAQIAHYSQQQIDDLCLSVGWEVINDANIKILAEMAVNETGMGNVADKIAKHKGKVLGVLDGIKGAKSVGLIEEDKVKKIKKYAKPVGVIGALTPVTNPTATPSSNGIAILKGRNAVIFAPHPRSKKCSAQTVQFMRQGLKRVGAPEDLVQIIESPSIQATNELMAQVDLVLATGGGPMVKAAYSSGTPAYGVGPGNSVQIIAEDANIEDAMKKVALSKCFDNATSCSSENSIVVHSSLYKKSLELLQNAENGYLCAGEEKTKLREWMWAKNDKGYEVLNPQIVAKSAVVIAQEAGFDVPAQTRLLIVEGSMPLEQDLFAMEKLSPVLTTWSYDSFEEGYAILKRLTDNCGTGHSCGIHTNNQDYVEYLAENMQTSRIMVNQPQAPANGGNFFNGMPSTTTLGCGTWGGNITTENIYYKHFLNITWVSELLPVNKPDETQFFAEFFNRYQK